VDKRPHAAAKEEFMRVLMCSGLAIWIIMASRGMGGAEDSKLTLPPAGAKVLFDGKGLTGWLKRDGKPTEWKVVDGVLQCVPGKGDVMTSEKFGPDFHLHIEFWLPLMEKAKGQGRANSGVYLQGRYEIQVLDSYMNETYENGSVGALYGLIAPDKAAQQKAVKPPESWNAYDITFHAPRADATGKVTEKGKLTVKLNGVTLIENGQFDKVTGGAINSRLDEPGPILLQDHGNTVRFRNIWLKPLEK
jgi:hypothetical protein